MDTGGDWRRRLARLDSLYAKAVRRLIFVLFAAMVITTFLATVFRYAPMLSGLYWAEEVTRYLSIWVVFLAAGLGIQRGAQLGVDLFVQALPPGLARVTLLAGLLLMASFEALLVVLGTVMVAANMDQLSSALEIRMGWPFLAIPVGGVLMLIETLRGMVAVAHGKVAANAGA